MTLPTKQDCILEIPEIEYDKTELVKIYEQVKGYSRIKRRPNKVYPPGFVSKTLVMQYDDHGIPNPEDFGKSVNFLDFEYIRNIAEQFNLKKKIHPGNITMMSYADGFDFNPHVDGPQASSVIMFPFIATGSTAEIDFYYQENIDYVPFENYEDMGYSKIFYSHTYSDKYPTVFNSQIIHGIKPISGFQVRLKINVPEKLLAIRQRYESGLLLI